jgi:DNA ligase-4
LFRAFSTIKPYKAAQSHASDTRTKDIFARWVKGIRTNYDPLPLGTTAALFRLVFPQVDGRRKYGMQEAKLASLLAQVFSLPDDMKAQLLGWKHGSGTGCLGSELERVLETRDIVRSPLLLIISRNESLISTVIDYQKPEPM